MSQETQINPQAIIESTPERRYFEGVDIQWDRVPWSFDHPDGRQVSIDTYSIWNPSHHQEIAQRLAEGERCALYMMGNFGVGELFQKTDGEDRFEILDKIKKRDRVENLVVFASPEEMGDYIDFERLSDSHKNLELSENRESLYPGPMHAIFPIKEEKMPSKGLVRESDNSSAFFWMPGHYGYEQLLQKLKTQNVGGLFGGGSLNIHGQKPSYTAEQLKDREMKLHPEWLDNIDFVILDEIAEASNIGRSHTQISFLEDPPQVLRVGALTPGKISRETGYQIKSQDDVKKASSVTPYDREHDEATDRKVEFVLARIGRYQSRLEGGLISSGPQI